MKRRLLSLLAALLGCLLLSSASAELPESLEEIGSSAFEGDAALTGVLTLPESVSSVGSRAFAGTGLHALILPEGCQRVAADVLAGTDAAYVTLNGAQTAVTASALTDVCYVFAPEGSAAASLAGFYASETLYVQDGFFYSLAQEEAIPLCAVDGAAVSGSVVLPKMVDGLPLRQLDTLVLRGCGDVSLSVPSYLTMPDGLKASAYDAMTVSAPVASVTECTVGDYVTWTTAVTGAYGDVSYIWRFETGGVISSIITAQPTVTWSPMVQGLCCASVTAVDAVNDRAEASGEGVTVGEAIPMYRALLIGNTYPGTTDELTGCDTDARAMSTVLGSMGTTDYVVRTLYNVSASQMQSAIASTFADARICDVSLFYFSGHGTSSGALVGTGNTVVSVSTLRSWLDAIPGTKIVIIDCCYSGMMIGKSVDATDPSAFTGAFISGFSSFAKSDNLATNGYVVMTACSKTQLSQTLSDGTVSFGAFTYGVCYGSGYDAWNQTSLGSLPADTNSDGAVTLSEAYSKAKERVSWLATIVTDLTQSAQYYGDGSFILWQK